ncbi:MAG: glutaredoxin family protein [Patescibacteria group bacterium]
MTPPKITIYTTHTCPFCKMEKAFLDEKKITYDEVFVDDNDAKKAEMINLSGQMGTPVTRLEYPDGESRQFSGFNPARMEQLAGGEKVGEALVQTV